MSTSVGWLVGLGGIVVFACCGYMSTNTCIDNRACQFDVRQLCSNNINGTYTNLNSCTVYSMQHEQ